MAKKKTEQAEPAININETPVPLVEDDGVLVVAEPVIMVPAPGFGLKQFKMPVRNSCFKCGALLNAGDAVFAFSMNAVVAGGGFCAKCAGEVG